MTSIACSPLFLLLPVDHLPVKLVRLHLHVGVRLLDCHPQVLLNVCQVLWLIIPALQSVSSTSLHLNTVGFVPYQIQQPLLEVSWVLEQLRPLEAHH